MQCHKKYNVYYELSHPYIREDERPSRGGDFPVLLRLDRGTGFSAQHPLRQIRLLGHEAIKRPDRTFERLYGCAGRPSIPPEQLLLELLLQTIYGLRSGRLLLGKAWEMGRYSSLET